MTHTMNRDSGSSRRERGAFGVARLLLAGALLAGGAPAGPLADDPLKVAEKQFEKGLKQAIATLKVSIKEAEKLAIDDLASWEKALEDGVLITTANTASSIANRIEDYQVAVGAALYEAVGTASSLGHSLLDDLEDAGVLEVGYPVSFHAGTRGAADRLCEKAAKLAAQSAARLRKRLDRTIDVVLKMQGYNVAIRLDAARPGIDFSANIDIVFIGEIVPLTIDFAVAVSNASDANDARMVAGGQADPDVGDVDIAAWGSDLSSGDTATPDDETRRWRATLTDGGDMYAEGNVVLQVSQGTGGPETMSMGLR